MVLASSFRYLKYMIYLCFAFGEMLAFGRVRKHAPEPIPREPHRIMADPDPVFVQEILDLAQRRKTAGGKYRRQVEDLRAVLELPARGAFYHTGRLRDARLGPEAISSASTPARTVGSLRSARPT